MEIVSTAVYVGPNIYARLPLIRFTVDLHRRATTPVSEYRDRLAPLFELLPGLLTATTERGEPFAERLDAADCHLGELMAQVAVALQNHAGAPADVAMVRPGPHEEEVEVLFGYESEEVGLEAGEVARGILIELIAPREDEPADIDEAIADFDDYAGRRALGPSALALVQGGRGARHPVGAPERRQPDPGRAGQVPEAHRGGADQPDLAYRGRDRLRQGAVLAPAVGPRPAGAAPDPRPRRRGRRRRRGGASASRWW